MKRAAPAEYRVEQRAGKWVLLARVPPNKRWYVLPTQGGFSGAHAAIPFYAAAAERWHNAAAYRPCTSCGRPMRRRAWKSKHHPGTVAEESKGICRGCARYTGPDPDLESIPVRGADQTPTGQELVRLIRRFAGAEPGEDDYLLDTLGLRDDDV